MTLMNRFAYLWLLFSVVLSLGVVAYDSHARDEAIRNATKGALYTGVKAGCDRDNALIDEVVVTARRLHPDEANAIRQDLKPEPCRLLASTLVEDYLRSSP